MRRTWLVLAVALIGCGRDTPPVSEDTDGTLPTADTDEVASDTDPVGGDSDSAVEVADTAQGYVADSGCKVAGRTQHESLDDLLEELSPPSPGWRECTRAEVASCTSTPGDLTVVRETPMSGGEFSRTYFDADGNFVAEHFRRTRSQSVWGGPSVSYRVTGWCGTRPACALGAWSRPCPDLGLPLCSAAPSLRDPPLAPVTPGPAAVGVFADVDTQPSWPSGLPIGPIGDLDGDGIDDMVLLGGGPSYDVQLVSGAAPGAAPFATITGVPLLQSLPRAGDLDGDGHDDLVIVATNPSAGGWAGEVHVFRGPLQGTSALITSTSVIVSTATERMGGVAAFADLAGERVLAVSGTHLGPSAARIVYTFAASDLLTRSVVLDGSTPGWWVSADSMIALDGRLALAARYPSGLFVASEAPRARVASSALAEISDDGLRSVASPHGDLDGDGHADLILPGPFGWRDGHEVVAYVLTTLPELSTPLAALDPIEITAEAAYDYGFDIIHTDAADLNGDDVMDLLVSAPYWGPVRACVEDLPPADLTHAQGIVAVFLGPLDHTQSLDHPDAGWAGATAGREAGVGIRATRWDERWVVLETHA